MGIGSMKLHLYSALDLVTPLIVQAVKVSRPRLHYGVHSAMKSEPR